jgi:hypothetical protein
MGEGTDLHGFDLEFEGGVFIDDDHGVGVELETGEGPHVIDAAFDALLQREGFVGTGDNDDDLSCLEGGRSAGGCSSDV